MATTLATIAIINAQSASRTATCAITMHKFNPEIATVSEMQDYAACVNHIYPDTIAPESVIIFKVLFVAALLGVVYGVWKERHCGILDSIMYGFVMGCLFPCVLIGLGGLFYGVLWLFS